MWMVMPLVGSPSFEEAVGIMAAEYLRSVREYLRVVWMSARFAVQEPDMLDCARPVCRIAPFGCFR
jgi:hypothetical protein